jgi:predicted flap endonuclease-1-like 5' DNA nuclease
MTALVDVEGIGEAYAQKLKSAGIKTIEELLGEGCDPKGRQMIAEKTGISDKLILRWVNHADLFRIKGVGSEYADLLEYAGVDTVPELAQRNPENLHAKLVATNEEKKLVRRVPTVDEVTRWVEEAKKLPRVLTY